MGYEMFRQEETEKGRPFSKREEAKLIERAKRRDAAALRALIEAHQQRLFAFVWRIVRNRDDAEELCQEAFLRAFSALDTFDENYRFSTWLFTIAYRLTLNSLRRKRPGTPDIDLGTLAGKEVVEDRTAHSAEVRELKEAVWSAVDQLSPPATGGDAALLQAGNELPGDRRRARDSGGDGEKPPAPGPGPPQRPPGRENR